MSTPTIMDLFDRLVERIERDQEAIQKTPFDDRIVKRITELRRYIPEREIMLEAYQLNRKREAERKIEAEKLAKEKADAIAKKKAAKDKLDKAES